MTTTQKSIIWKEFSITESNENISTWNNCCVQLLLASRSGDFCVRVCACVIVCVCSDNHHNQLMFDCSAVRQPQHTRRLGVGNGWGWGPVRLMKFQEANECLHSWRASSRGFHRGVTLIFKVLGVGFIKQYLSPLLMDALKAKIDDSFFVFWRGLWNPLKDHFSSQTALWKITV